MLATWSHTTTITPVSYTHLDVYKRQVLVTTGAPKSVICMTKRSLVGRVKWTSIAPIDVNGYVVHIFTAAITTLPKNHILQICGRSSRILGTRRFNCRRSKKDSISLKPVETSVDRN